MDTNKDLPIPPTQQHQETTVDSSHSHRDVIPPAELANFQELQKYNQAIIKEQNDEIRRLKHDHQRPETTAKNASVNPESIENFKQAFADVIAQANSNAHKFEDQTEEIRRLELENQRLEIECETLRRQVLTSEDNHTADSSDARFDHTNSKIDTCLSLIVSSFSEIKESLSKLIASPSAIDDFPNRLSGKIDHVVEFLNGMNESLEALSPTTLHHKKPRAGILQTPSNTSASNETRSSLSGPSRSANEESHRVSSGSPGSPGSGRTPRRNRDTEILWRTSPLNTMQVSGGHIAYDTSKLQISLDLRSGPTTTPSSRNFQDGQSHNHSATRSVDGILDRIVLPDHSEVTTLPADIVQMLKEDLDFFLHISDTLWHGKGTSANIFDRGVQGRQKYSDLRCRVTGTKNRADLVLEACENCISDRHFCILKFDRNTKLFLAPLPESIRPAEATSADIDYWLLS